MESGSYDLLKIGRRKQCALAEFSNFVGGTLDSAAEDCTTGIALSSDEFSDDIYVTDLTSGHIHGRDLTAPGQFLSLNDGGYSAGTLRYLVRARFKPLGCSHR